MLDATIRNTAFQFGVICCETVGQRRNWTKDESIYVCSVADIQALFLETRRSMDYQTKLVNALEKVQMAAKAKSDFLHNISHELRTPLNGILGVADILLRTELDQKQTELLNALTSSGESLLAQIDDLISFSAREAGCLTEDSAFDLKETVQSAVNSAMAAACKKNLALHLDFDETANHKFIGDPTGIRKVLVNLIDNAVKFTDAGVVTVRVELDDEGVQFSVSDTGKGISQEKLARIFDEFTQGENGLSRSHGGMGMGLPLAQKLARKMGGMITAQSRPGAGSTFSFALPLADA